MKKPKRSRAWKRMQKEKASRTCGTCTACCTVMGVAELGKPYAYPCLHLCEAGCSIYPTRPSSCAGFECLWRQGAIGGPGMRPEKSGVLIVLQRKHNEVELGVFELRDGAASDRLVGQIIDRLRPLYDCTTIYPVGSICGTTYSLSNEYPDSGDVGYLAPAIPLAADAKVYFGLFRPRYLLESRNDASCNAANGCELTKAG